MQERAPGLLPETAVEAIPSGAVGSKRAGLGSLQEQGECRWQQDYVGTAGARVSAGVLHVLGVPGSHRTTGTSALSSGDMGSSCTQHSASSAWEAKVGSPKQEIITGETVFLIRIL